MSYYAKLAAKVQADPETAETALRDTARATMQDAATIATHTRLPIDPETFPNTEGMTPEFAAKTWSLYLERHQKALAAEIEKRLLAASTTV